MKTLTFLVCSFMICWGGIVINQNNESDKRIRMSEARIEVSFTYPYASVEDVLKQAAEQLGVSYDSLLRDFYDGLVKVKNVGGGTYLVDTGPGGGTTVVIHHEDADPDNSGDPVIRHEDSDPEG